VAEPLFPEVVRLPDLVARVDGRGPLADLRTLFRRAAMVGGKVIVAAAPSYDRVHRFNGQAEAWRRAAEIVGLLGERAAPCGLSIALQPSAESAALAGTIEEAWVLAEEVGHPAVGVAMDMALVDDWADLAAAGKTLKHLHLPLPRRFGGAFDTERWFEALAALREFAYSGRLSLAAAWSSFSAHAAELLEALRGSA
jgi:hypothetical protein